MNLSDLKNSYVKGDIDKQRYIHQMHLIHRHLFEYAEFIKHCDVKKIEIEDGEVIMTSRDFNIRMLCDERDQRIAPLEMVNFGSYEKLELKMTLGLIEPGEVIYDIGGNFGWYSLVLSTQIPRIKIHAFEPIPKTFEYFKKNIRLNQIDSVTLHSYGLSDESRIVDFFFYPEVSGNASMVNLSKRDSVTKIKAQVKRLDDVAESIGEPPDFIKCDVEGAELNVFKGGLLTLEESKPIVFTEMLRKWSAQFNYHPNDIIKLFDDLNYDCFFLKGNRLVLVSSISDQTVETNFFFLHRVKHREKIEWATDQCS